MTTDLRPLFDKFINERQYCSRLSSKTVVAYKSVFQVFCTIMPEVTTVEFLNAAMITEFFKRLQTRERQVGTYKSKSGVKDSTILAYRTKLKTFCEWLKGEGLLVDNPFSKIKAPLLHWEDRKILSQDDIKALYSSVVLYAHFPYILRRDTMMLSLLLFLGVRRNEFLSLELRDIDLEKHTITIRSVTSKSGRTRIIPMHATLIMHVKDYLAERKRKSYKTPFLIASHRKDSGLTLNGLKHWVDRLCKKSGVSFHLHQFRHTFACILAQNNVHAAKIQKLLGHSNLLMTTLYLRSIDTEDLEDDINKISF